MKNFIIRTVTGVAFVAVMVGGILYSPITCGLLFLLINILSVWEFTGLVNSRADVQVNRFITTVAGACLYLGVFGFVVGVHDAPPLFLPWLASIAYLLIAELYLRRDNPINNWAYTMMAQIYVALPFSLLTIVAFAGLPGFMADTTEGCDFMGLYYILAIFVLLWCNDTGAYCTGSLIGRHKLFPRISPGKTWEGSVGGAVLAVAASQVFAHFVPTLTALQWAGFAIVVVVFGTWGDLVESLLKRQLGVKDSGNILPGHGGMLDRFDSSLLAIPATVVYLSLLSLI